jgi:hypothetical protein
MISPHWICLQCGVFMSVMKTIFVGGSQRSGTTLLNKFLCLDANTNPKIAEASYLRDLLVAYQNAQSDFDHDSASYFDDVNDLQQFHATVVNLFLHRTLKRFSGASTLVLKELHLTQFFPELFELVPHVRFVMIVRDPRDIIASMIQVGERMKANGEQHFFQSRNIPVLCQQVLSFYGPSLNNRNPAFRNAMLLLRYEDLIRHTGQVQKQLAQFTGLKLDFSSDTNPNNALEGSKNNADPLHATQKRYLPWITDNNGKEINESSIGKFRQVLTEAEVAIVNQHLQSFMKMFDYMV